MQSRAGNPTPTLQQKAFVAPVPHPSAQTFRPCHQRAPALSGSSVDNQVVSMQGHSLQGWGQTGMVKREVALVTDRVAILGLSADSCSTW